MSDKKSQQVANSTADDDSMATERGRRPPQAGSVADPPSGDQGHYSGQEYDSPEQAEWRCEQATKSARRYGRVEGAGAAAGGGNDAEDYDSDLQGGGGTLPMASGRPVAEDPPDTGSAIDRRPSSGTGGKTGPGR